jgi:hypothetical protein
VLETFVELMPGHFSITKRDFGSTWPDVWGFRSHFTHNNRGKRTGRKMQKEGTKPKWRSTNNKGNRTHKQQYNKRETKKEQIVF